ncbi:MAG: hypothetical protein FJ405_14870, partial [Verrucomicrobia bacterium]|nr:hypothetical protein [Verrucomicrobiota bacterium]
MPARRQRSQLPQLTTSRCPATGAEAGVARAPLYVPFHIPCLATAEREYGAAFPPAGGKAAARARSLQRAGESQFARRLYSGLPPASPRYHSAFLPEQLMAASSQSQVMNAVTPILLACFSLCCFPSALRAVLPQEANSAPADSVICFNEVMYHPASDAKSEEWIELHNQMFVDVDLSNWSLTGAVQYRFQPGTILPIGGYLVVAANPLVTASNFGLARVHGPWTGALNNSGETLTLRNHNGRLMDQFRYSDDFPWPAGADGAGASLAKLRRLTPSGPASNWRASSQVGGTPGRVNFAILDGGLSPTEMLFGRGDSARLLVPSAADTSANWTDPGFDDAVWKPVSASIGFDLNRSPGPQPPAVHAFFSFDNTLLDGSGNGLHAINSGGVFSSNLPPQVQVGRTLDFNGASAYAQVNDASDPEAYTLALWVRADSIRACSILVRTDSSGPGTAWSHQIRLNSAGRAEHYTWDGAARLVTGTTQLSRSNWYHLTVTARSGGTMRLYVNGVQEGAPVDIGTLRKGLDQWRFASSSGDNRNFLDGRISQAGIWHHELAPAEIAQLAAGTSPLLLGGLGALFLSDVQSDLSGKSSTAWLRIPFSVPEGPGFEALSLETMFADGYVALLNGVEISRVNAPQVLSWDSAAAGNRELSNALKIATLDLSNRVGLLRVGENVLSVHALNSSASDTNFFFSAQLSGRRLTEPLDGSAVSFSEISGATAQPFWIELHNGGSSEVDLAGYRIARTGGPGTTLPRFKIPAGGFGVLTSAELGFVPAAGQKIHLISADGMRALDSASVPVRSIAREPAVSRGPWLNHPSPTPGAANLIPKRTEIVINEIMYHHAPSYPMSGKPAVNTNILLLPFDAEWNYNVSGDDLGTAWKEVGYGDGAWARGQATIGAASGVLPVPLKTPAPHGGKTTFYFRTRFDASSIPQGASLFLTALIDDGAAFYLNGREVHRQNLSNGPISYLSRAITNIQSITLSRPVRIPAADLVQGLNTFAVEVHQFQTNATADFAMAARLHLSQEVEPGVPGESYLENDEEWVELFNRSQEVMDLSGWGLAGGIDYAFPNRTRLEPGHYLVIARDIEAFRAKHPNVRALGDFSGKLSDTSDRVILLDSLRNPADEVLYFSEAPWPEAADGGGS